MNGRQFIVTAMLAFALSPAQAADVRLIGVFAGKAAVISVDGGAPKTVRVGQTWSGVRVIDVDRANATIEFEGRRRTLRQGQYTQGGDSPSGGGVILTADSRGHFVTPGLINGVGVRFLVDTGASMVTLSTQLADRIGVDYREAPTVTVNTANGRVRAWRVKFDTASVGAIRLHNVDGVVVQEGPELVLLGMSFLNRLEMQRDGDSMRLKRRY